MGWLQQEQSKVYFRYVSTIVVLLAMVKVVTGGVATGELSFVTILKTMKKDTFFFQDTKLALQSYGKKAYIRTCSQRGNNSIICSV